MGCVPHGICTWVELGEITRRSNVFSYNKYTPSTTPPGGWKVCCCGNEYGSKIHVHETIKTTTKGKGEKGGKDGGSIARERDSLREGRGTNLGVQQIKQHQIEQMKTFVNARGGGTRRGVGGRTKCVTLDERLLMSPRSGVGVEWGGVGVGVVWERRNRRTCPDGSPWKHT